MYPNRAFIPKVPTVANVNRKISLSAFHPNPQNREERHLHCLCPVRALRYYIQKAQGIRKDRQLFVSYGGRTLGKKVSSLTISRWIRKLICDAYKQMGRQIPEKEVRAHSTRAAAASLADLMGASVEDLCEAATWSSLFGFCKALPSGLCRREGNCFPSIGCGNGCDATLKLSSWHKFNAAWLYNWAIHNIVHQYGLLQMHSCIADSLSLLRPYSMSVRMVDTRRTLVLCNRWVFQYAVSLAQGCPL